MIERQPDDWGHGRYRLRDLRGRERGFAAAMLVLVLVPFAVALARAFHDGWVPSGDEANIATRALEVFSKHPPLTGLPSTSALYGDKIATNHPGPIEFYLLAVPLRVLGMSIGPLLTAAAINLSFVLAVLFTFFRRLGLITMLWVGVLTMMVMWSGGTAVLTDTLSSNMTMYSLLATAVLTWAVVDGDLALLPLAALAATYAAQQHLAAGVIVLALSATAVLALVIQIVVRIRRRDATVKKAALRWTVVAAAVSGVFWIPVADDELTGRPGNLTAVIRFARDSARPTLGLKSGFYQALHTIAPPTVLTRTDTSGFFFLHTPRTGLLAAGVLVVAALAVIAWQARRHAPGLARLALVALVLLAAGVVDGSNVPYSEEFGRINLYRWSWTAALLTWAALGGGAALLLVRANARLARRAMRLAPPALLVVCALIATSITFVSGADDHNRELPAFALEKQIATKLLDRIDRRHPVLVIPDGQDATLSVAPYVVLRLVAAGVPVQLSTVAIPTSAYVTKYRPRSSPAAIMITTGRVDRRTGPGELIEHRPFGPEHTARFDQLSAERSRLLDKLAASALGKKAVLAPGVGHRIYRGLSQLSQYHLATQLAFIDFAPRAALEDPKFLRVILSGALSQPAFDLTDVRRLLDLPAYPYVGTYGAEQVEVDLLTPEQLRTRMAG